MYLWTKIRPTPLQDVVICCIEKKAHHSSKKVLNVNLSVLSVVLVYDMRVNHKKVKFNRLLNEYTLSAEAYSLLLVVFC